MTSLIRYWRDPQVTHLSGDIPRGLSPSPFRDDMYVLYTVENLGKEGALAVMYRSVFPCNTSGLHPQQLMMIQCLLALAKVFYGLKHGASRVLRDGIRLYGQGLSMLNDILGKNNCSVTTEIMFSVFSLCVIEVCALPSRNEHVIV